MEAERRELTLTLGLGKSKTTFNLEKAVCNHGSFMMPPNRWNPSTKTLRRPLRLSGDNSVEVSISHSPLFPDFIYIRLRPSPFFSNSDAAAIFSQVTRMLRLSDRDEDDVIHFHSLHPQAHRNGFARLFRSPSVFEDAVKSILLCNVNWARSLQMAEALCNFQLEIISNDNESSSVGNFPTSKEIAMIGDEAFLTRLRPSLGYRANYVLKLAKDVEKGKLELDRLEIMIASDGHQKVHKILMAIKGFGSFASANVLMCLGHYQTIPADSETIRHLKQVHKLQTCNSKTIQKDVRQIYDKYAPFQCLAYWMELLEYYETKFGKLSQLSESSYPLVSGSDMRKRN